MFTGNETLGLLTFLYHMEDKIDQDGNRKPGALSLFRQTGLAVEPVFAENLLAMDPDQIDQVCTYYTTPKGGKQYPVEDIRRLLKEGQSLEPLMA